MNSIYIVKLTFFSQALIWSGSHRVNSGKEILHTHTRVSVSGHTQHNTFTLSLRNISSSQRSNYSLLTEVLAPFQYDRFQYVQPNHLERKHKV